MVLFFLNGPAGKLTAKRVSNDLVGQSKSDVTLKFGRPHKTISWPNARALLTNCVEDWVYVSFPYVSISVNDNHWLSVKRTVSIVFFDTNGIAVQVAHPGEKIIWEL